MNNKKPQITICAVIVFLLYMLMFVLCIAKIGYIPEGDAKRNLISIIIFLAMISIISVAFSLVILKIRQHMNTPIKRQLNPDAVYLKPTKKVTLDFLNMTFSGIAAAASAISLLISIVLCFMSIWMADNDLSSAQEFQGKLFSFDLIVIFLAVTFLSVRIFTKTNSELFHKKCTDNRIKDKNCPLEEIEMTVFFNRTRYMLSTYGNVSRKDNVMFIDIENELIPIRKDMAEIKRYLNNLDNYIFIIDHDDIAPCEKANSIPPIKQYSSLSELLYEVECEYQALSPLSMLTVGIINAPDELTVSQVKEKLAVRCNVLLYKNWSDISPEELIVSPDNSISHRSSNVGVPLSHKVKQDISMGVGVNLNMLWVILERESGYDISFSRCDSYLIKLLREMLFEPSETKRVMLGFDLLDFMLRMFSLHCWMLNSEKLSSEYEIPTSFSMLSKQITDNAKNAPEINEHLSAVYALPDIFVCCIKKIEVCFGYKIIGDSYNFRGMMSLLNEIRNKTRGHGVLTEANSGSIWNFLVCEMFFLMRSIDVMDFTIYSENGQFFTEHRGVKCCISSLIITEDAMPCIPVSASGTRKNSSAKKLRYMNYFSGKYIVPDVVK